MKKSAVVISKERIAERRRQVALHHGKMSNRVLAAKLGVSYGTIREDKRLLGLRDTPHDRVKYALAARADIFAWSKEEVELLRKEWGITPTAELEEKLGKTRKRIYNAVIRYDVTRNIKPKPPPKPKVIKEPKPREPRIWVEWRLKMLDEQYATTNSDVLAQQLGVATSTVKTMAATRKLKKLKKSERSARFSRGEPILKSTSEKFEYLNGLPWRAECLQGPAWIPPPLTYRGQK